MADISKRLERAEKYVQKGKLDAAIDEYLAAWGEDPNNDHVVEIVAELYLRQNMVKNALECYGFLFDKHVERHDGPRAVVVFRKMAKMGPPDPARLLAFAGFQERQKPDEALESYRQAARILLERGDRARALDALRGVAGLSDRDPEAQIQLGEVAESVGQKDVAAHAFIRAGQLLRASNSAERAMPLLERAQALAPRDGNAAQVLAQALMEGGNARRAAELLEPFALENVPERNRLLAEAHLAGGNCARAEEVLWDLAPHFHPAQQLLQRVAEGYLRRRSAEAAVALLRRLKKLMFGARRDREFVDHLEALQKKELATTEVLEFLASVYNELNYDSLFHSTQSRLFEQYVEAGAYEKAANALDHLVDVDPYDADNYTRLQLLAGRVDEQHYQRLAQRFQAPATPAQGGKPAPAATGEAEPAQPAADADDEEGGSLEDLVLQAEIFLQYGLKPRAVERLQKIAKHFPGEEARNDRLRALYASAQFTPKPSARAAVAGAPAPHEAGAAVSGADFEEIHVELARISEITRNIYRQGTAKAVLSTAVNEIGRTWRVSRCIAGLCTPGKPPSAAMEYCATTMKQSDVMSIVRLVTNLVQITADGNPLSAEDVSSSAKLARLRDTLQALEIQSLLALPLVDGEQPIGVVILEQCDRPRRWRSNEIVVLKTVVDQMVMATSHVKLRSLMKTLAVADERSGVLNRSSYIDCLLSESQRAQKQNTPLSVMLLKFGFEPVRMRQVSEEQVRQFMEEATQAFVGHLRQNDIGVRYDKTTLALVLPDTKGKDCLFVVDKIRRLVATITMPSGETLPLTAGVAEAVLASIEPVDSITELINRLEFALEAAETEGAGAKVLEPARTD